MPLEKIKFRILKSAALIRNGYKVVGSYLNPLVIKTDAPDDFMNKMRVEWEKSKLNQEYKSDIDFSEDKEISKKMKRKIARFLPNPERNWGPKSMASIKLKPK